MKRKNEILHSIRAALNDTDRSKLERANCVEEFSMNRVLSTLEAESIERRGFFEVNEQEEGDRLGLTGLYFYHS